MNSMQPPSAPPTASLDVDFTMAAKRSGRFETSNAQHMREKIDFDPPTFVGASGDILKSRRTAHTEGRMFGLTFWENWYILGENSPSEPPFKLVYYTGKTLQNTYSGAFVYARTPELPAEAMPSVYRLAREAGMNPNKFCRIRNACFAEASGRSAVSDAEPTSSAALSSATALVGIVEPPENSENPLRFRTSIEVPFQTRIKALWYDILDYIEDPHEAARWMFDQQQQMVWPFQGIGEEPDVSSASNRAE